MVHTARKRFDKFPEEMKHGRYIKKPIPVRAVQILEEFEVVTLEGTFNAKAGDYLMEGIKGEIYSCDKIIFEESYRAG